MNKKLLLKFCDTDDVRLKLPFSMGDYTYATDGRILIKVPRMSEYPENPLAPNPDVEHEKNPAKWYPVKGIKMPKKTDCRFCRGQGKNFVCPECHGETMVRISNDYSEYIMECKCCGSGGKIGFCEECDGTGENLQQHSMNFHGITFNQRYLALLSKLPNCEIGLISKTAVTPFRFDGRSGIIMPMRG